jgi:hypothetical protein
LGCFDQCYWGNCESEIFEFWSQCIMNEKSPKGPGSITLSISGGSTKRYKGPHKKENKHRSLIFVEKTFPKNLKEQSGPPLLPPSS